MMQWRIIFKIVGMLGVCLLVLIGGTACGQQPSDAAQPGVTTAPPATEERESLPATPALPTRTGEISREDAIRIATEYANGGTVSEVELNTERGARVYEVEFTNGSEVYVDVVTGRVAYAQLRSDDEPDEHHEEEHDDQHERDHHDE
jgi:hypothetical protein